MSTTIKANKKSKITPRIAYLAMISFALIPELAVAAPWDGAATQVLQALTGGFARTCAIIAVAALGYMAWAGKMSWERVFHIVLGIVFVFGGASIVDWISSSVS